MKRLSTLPLKTQPLDAVSFGNYCLSITKYNIKYTHSSRPDFGNLIDKRSRLRNDPHERLRSATKGDVT